MVWASSLDEAALDHQLKYWRASFPYFLYIQKEGPLQREGAYSCIIHLVGKGWS